MYPAMAAINNKDADEGTKLAAEDIPRYSLSDPLETSTLSAPCNNLDGIEEIPEPSEGTLEGLRQCTQSISSASTSLHRGESNAEPQLSKRSGSHSDPALSTASKSSGSSCSEIMQFSGSTCEHVYQEPFATYQHKVIELCQDIGLGVPSRVERMTGGAYNRVISISFPSNNNHDYVLRISRSPEADESARDQAGVLNHVATLVPAPKVLAFDPTSDNAIGHSYVLQEKLTGCNAAKIYYDLPLDEKIEVITLIVGVITKLNASKADRPGQIIAGPTIPSLSNVPLTIPTDIDITGYRFEREGTSTNMPRFEKQSLSSHLLAAFKMRKDYDRGRDQDFMDSTWRELSDITKQMDEAGLFSDADEDCVLWHWDLAFRNILIEKQNTGKWELTGVLDWDMLLAVPLVLTRATPTWLWCKEDSSCDKEIQPSRELTTDESRLKDHFEQAMQQADSNYMADTYGRGVWIRKLAHFAIYGFDSYVYYDKQRELVSEWNTYYTSLGFVPVADYSDDDDESCSPPNDLGVFSSGSSNPAASTHSSTAEYGQEGFDTYQLNVIQLCQDIGLGEPSKLERIQGGSYNRVVGLTFHDSPEDRQYILRVPRFTLEDRLIFNIRDQVAAILTLRQYDFLCAPAIAAVDTTAENSIKSQYVLQHRLRGKSLQEVFFALPLDEKLKITTVIAQYLRKMEKVSFSKPGLLTGTQSLPWIATSPDTSTSQPTISGFRMDDCNLAPALENQDLSSLLLKMLEAQKGDNYECQRLRWDKLISISKEMAKASLFRKSDSKYALWHWDICARHILISGIEPSPASDSSSKPDSPYTNSSDTMVDTDESMIDEETTRDAPSEPETEQQINNGGWKVTGVVDWDDAMSVPLVISRMPRTWLWFNDEKRGWTWDGNRDTPPNRELTQEELTIKGHFDQVMQQADPEYLEDTYGRGVWIRKLFRFAKDGFESGADVRRYNKFVSDWMKYYSNLCI